MKPGWLFCFLQAHPQSFHYVSPSTYPSLTTRPTPNLGSTGFEHHRRIPSLDARRCHSGAYRCPHCHFVDQDYSAFILLWKPATTLKTVSSKTSLSAYFLDGDRRLKLRNGCIGGHHILGCACHVAAFKPELLAAGGGSSWLFQTSGTSRPAFSEFGSSSTNQVDEREAKLSGQLRTQTSLRSHHNWRFGYWPRTSKRLDETWSIDLSPSTARRRPACR